MSQFYCFTCDRYRDSNEEDHADYSGKEIICGDCVDELEEQINQEHQAWALAIDADEEEINGQVNY